VLLGEASRSAPSAPTDSRLRALAASSRRRRPSCRTRPPPSAAAASARRKSRVGRRISSKAFQLIPGRLERQRVDPAPHLLAGPAEPRRGGGPARCVRLARRQQRLVEEQPLRRRSAQAPPRLPPERPGKCAALIASPIPASPRGALRSSAGNPSIAFGRPICRPALAQVSDSLRFQGLGRRMDRDKSSRAAGSCRGGGVLAGGAGVVPFLGPSPLATPGRGRFRTHSLRSRVWKPCP